MTKLYDAVVIGAGLAGIAVSLRLRKMGLSVLVLEKNETFGGKLSEFEWGEYRWDKGPSLFTLPKQVDELFELFGKQPREFFDYHEMEESCHYYFNDGSDFLFPANPSKRNEALKKHFGEDEGQKVINYLAESKDTYAKLGNLFIDHPQYGIKNILDKKLVKQYPNLVTRKLMGSLDAFNNRKLSDPNLINVFNRYATYNGSNPYKLSGLYSMIPHLEINEGTYFPTKGMYSIVQSLYDLAVEQKVDFKFNQTNIEVKYLSQSSEKEVVTSDAVFKTKKVISAIDCVNFYEKVLKDQSLALKYAKKERSSSGVVFYWAVEKIIPELKLHNIFFGANYKNEFENIFGQQTFSEFPTVYIHVSSTVNPDDAPSNGQNWFVMINTPAGIEVSKEQLASFRNYVYRLIMKKFDVDLSFHIKHEAYWDQAKIDEYTGAYKGALYGASSNQKTAAIKRHGNKSKKYDDLYFCGGTVHPGGGIPLVLKSAKIVAQLINETNGH